MSPSHHIFFSDKPKSGFDKRDKEPTSQRHCLKVRLYDWFVKYFVYLLDTDIDLLDITKLTKQFNVYLCRDLTHIAVRYHEDKVGDRK